MQSSKVGTVGITFHAGSSATLVYTLGSDTGTLNLQRFDTKTLHLDGIYQGTAVSSSTIVNGILCGSAIMASAVVDHDLSGFALDSDSDFYTLSATVDSSGNIASGAFADGGQNHATFGGSVNGDNGSGSWTDAFGCSGTWSATAQ